MTSCVHYSGSTLRHQSRPSPFRVPRYSLVSFGDWVGLSSPPERSLHPHVVAESYRPSDVPLRYLIPLPSTTVFGNYLPRGRGSPPLMERGSETPERREGPGTHLSGDTLGLSETGWGPDLEGHRVSPGGVTVQRP